MITLQQFGLILTAITAIPAAWVLFDDWTRPPQ